MTRRPRSTTYRNKKAHLSYHLPTSEDLSAIEKQQIEDFSKFVEYYRKVPHLGFEKAFKLWWVFNGPNGFYKTEDTKKYQLALRSYILTKLEAAKGEDDQVHTG
jgi:hypothetical protein